MLHTEQESTDHICRGARLLLLEMAMQNTTHIRYNIVLHPSFRSDDKAWKNASSRQSAAKSGYYLTGPLGRAKVLLGCEIQAVVAAECGKTTRSRGCAAGGERVEAKQEPADIADVRLRPVGGLAGGSQLPGLRRSVIVIAAQCSCVGTWWTAGRIRPIRWRESRNSVNR